MSGDVARGNRPGMRPSAVWHACGADQVLALLGTTAEGLSTEEAGLRLAAWGANVLPATPRRHPAIRFVAQFNNTLIYLLAIGAVAALLLGHLIDAAVILVVVLVNGVVGFLQEGKAEKALDAIKSMIAPRATVMRDGLRRSVPAGELVPGDIVQLEAGDRIPADLRLLRTRGLLVDEALLTGESLAADKSEAAVAPDASLGDRRGMAFSGTLVAAGQGTGVVVETGLHAQIGRISSLLGTVEETATPLIRQIEDFGRKFTAFVLIGAALLFTFAVIVRQFHWADALIAVVALAVGVVPEGLPAVITITLAIGVGRMAVRNAVIRKLPAVETLGATSVICSDKTGTLTRNEMTARRIVTGVHHVTVTGSGYQPDGELIAEGDDDAAAVAAAVEVIRCGLLCNDAEVRQSDGSWTVHGDPMEGALVTLSMKAGLSPSHLRAEWPRLDVIPFDAGHRFMASLHHGPAGERIAFVKGAPEALIDMAAPPDRARWEDDVAVAGAEGERLLAFGIKRLPAGSSRLERGDLKEGVQFLGLVGFIDPPRLEAMAAIAECHLAGIAVKMITGDHIATALAIARQLDMAKDLRAISGPELDRLSDDQLRAVAREVSVFARTSPEHKLRIVRALQAGGAIVAMTGDGVNDAPSLKQADVGTAMGQKGTEAAKEAADMVLLDDNFASIVSAIREGRTVYENIRKVITWTLPTNGGEMLVVVIAILAGFALPMTATQILWVNLVLEGTLGLALAFEPSEPGVMRRRPRPADAALLSPFLLWRVVLVSALLAGISLGLYFYALGAGRDLDTARTMVVNLLIVAELFYLFNVRYLHSVSISLRGVIGTRAVLLAISVVVAAQLLFTYAPFMQVWFASRPLSLADGALVLALGVAMMLLLEGEKMLMRRFGWFSELNV